MVIILDYDSSLKMRLGVCVLVKTSMFKDDGSRLEEIQLSVMLVAATIRCVIEATNAQ